MGYTMGTDGSVVLPVEVEQQAFAAAARAMAPLQGWFPAEGEPEARSLDDLAGFVGAALTREHDRVDLSTDETADPKWSDQATAFYLALAPYVSSGEVRFTGEDDGKWSYRYEGGSLTQHGINGWDGSSTPFGPPADLSADLPVDPHPGPPPDPAERRRGTPAPEPSSWLGLSPTVTGLLIGLAVLVVLLLAL